MKASNKSDIWDFLVFVNHPEDFEVSVNRDRSFNVRDAGNFHVQHMSDPKYVKVNGIRKHLLRYFGLYAIVMPWRRCYVVPECWGDAALEAHEEVHFDQIEEDGPLKFTLKYIGYHIRYGYRKNPYEIEAYAVSDAYMRGE